MHFDTHSKYEIRVRTEICLSCCTDISIPIDNSEIYECLHSPESQV